MPIGVATAMKPYLIWLWLAQAADVGTTLQATSRGCVEANTLMRSRPVMLGVKSGVTIGLTIHFGRKREPKPEDKAVVAAFAAVGTAAALWNATRECSYAARP